MRPKPWCIVLIRAVAVSAIALLLLPSAWAEPKFKVLASVPGGLWTGLTLDAKGNLYGVTSGGGANGVGSVFELSRSSKGKWSVTTLHSFEGTDGSSPNGNLIFDAGGNLYGTANDGGLYDRGTVFELAPGSGGWTFAVIYNFCSELDCPDGAEPDDGLTLDKAGNLYGTAGGGPDCCGVAYELSPGFGGWSETVLYDFGSKPYDATASYAPLVFGKTGDLYGTSYSGGKYHGGTVFMLAHHADGWSERVLYSFCRKGGYLCKDGAGPEGRLAFDAAGNLYSTTDGGGPYRAGALFKLTPARDRNWKEAILYGFGDPEKGVAPASGIVRGSGGVLYGTTALGGSGGCDSGCGVVYKLAPKANGKWTYTVLHKFDGTDGGLPDGGVILDKRGNLYGTAYSTVFEVTP
jgi:uncharacterized repeat protein (TIGR03803 family)